MTNSFVEYIETTYAVFCNRSQRVKGDDISRTWRQRGVDARFGNEISLKYALGERRGALTVKSAFDFSRALSWSVGPQTCLLLLSRLQNCRQPRDDATVPGVGWPSLLFWVMEETLCLGPYIMDRHGLWVSDHLVVMKWLVCGGNLLISFLSGFLNMWPRKRSWR